MTYRSIHILIGCHTQYHPDVAKERGDDDTLHDDEFQDAPRLGTNRLADAELMGALLDGDEHDVRDAHDTTQQGEQAHNPQGCADDADTRLHLQVIGVTVPEPHAPLVLGVCLMVGIDFAPIAFLKVLVSLLGSQSVEGELDRTCIIRVGTEDALDG